MRSVKFCGCLQPRMRFTRNDSLARMDFIFDGAPCTFGQRVFVISFFWGMTSRIVGAREAKFCS